MSSRADLDSVGMAVSEMRLPAAQSSLSPARRYVQETAGAYGFDDDACYKLVFAVNEAVTNAIKHGGPDEQGLISLSAEVDERRLTFVVRDYGTFLVSPLSGSTSVEHGRGLSFMASLADEVSLSAKPGGTVVRLSKARD